MWIFGDAKKSRSFKTNKKFFESEDRLSIELANALDRLTSKIKVDWFYIDEYGHVRDLYDPKESEIKNFSGIVELTLILMAGMDDTTANYFVDALKMSVKDAALLSDFFDKTEEWALEHRKEMYHVEV